MVEFFRITFPGRLSPSGHTPIDVFIFYVLSSNTKSNNNTFCCHGDLRECFTCDWPRPTLLHWSSSLSIILPSRCSLIYYYCLWRLRPYKNSIIMVAQGPLWDVNLIRGLSHSISYTLFSITKRISFLLWYASAYTEY